MEASNIIELLPTLRLALLFAEYDRLDALFNIGLTHAEENVYDWYFELIGEVMEFVQSGYKEEYQINTWYFSDRNMMEYYRLCRTYSSAHKVRLKDNPYMHEAKRAMECALDFGGGYGYGWVVNTKVNHKWASGIFFQSDSYFTGDFLLLGAMLEIASWYQHAVYRLRHQLLTERSLWLPALPAPKEETP